MTMLFPSVLENLQRQYPPVSGEGKRELGGGGGGGEVINCLIRPKLY